MRMQCQSTGSMLDVTRQSPRTAGTSTGGSQGDWYVAYTEPRREALAQQHLQRQQFEVYLPLYRVMTRRTRTAQARTAECEPMFPRYLFLRPTKVQQSLSVVRSTRGVTAMIRFGAVYAQLHHDVVAAIQAREREQHHSSLLAVRPMQPGTQVRITNPALDGLEGLVHAASSQRIVVLLDILGQQTRVKLREEDVRVA
ncbi:transcriptional activator RfaH [Allopusillimonas soli]|nr:transcriptional activator RfaH [Allopusillimonas soli]